MICHKRIPKTILATSASFYTQLYTVEYWQNRPESLSYREEVLRILTQHSVQANIQTAILNVADRVDALEKRLSFPGTLQNNMGVGPSAPIPILSIPPPSLRPFLVTLLLDRLVWAATYNGEPLNVKTYHRSDHHIPKPSSVEGGRRFIDFNSDHLTKLISDVVAYSDLIASAPPSWRDQPTLGASIQDVSTQDPPPVVPPELRPFVTRTATAINVASTTSSLSKIFSHIANIASIAASASFLIHDGTEIDYFAVFLGALDNLASSPAQRESLCQASKIIKEKVPGERIGVAIGPILTCFASSPLIVLDPRNDIATLHAMQGKPQRWGTLIPRVCEVPIATTKSHLLAEAAIWNRVAEYLNAPSPSPGPLIASTHGPHIDHLLPSLQTATDVLDKISYASQHSEHVVTISELDWPHMGDLPYQTHAQIAKAQDKQIQGEEPLRQTPEPDTQPHADVVPSASNPDTADDPTHSQTNNQDQTLDRLRPRPSKTTPLPQQNPKDAPQPKKTKGGTKPSKNVKELPQPKNTRNKSTEPDLVSIKFEESSYVPSSDYFRDWVEAANSLPGFKELKPTCKQLPAKNPEISHDFEVALTINGALVPHKRTYSMTWPAGTSEAADIFSKIMQNRVPPTFYQGPLPDENSDMTRLPEGDVFPRAYIDAIIDPATPLHVVEGIRKLVATRTILIPSPNRSTIPHSWDKPRPLLPDDLEERLGMLVDLPREAHKLIYRNSNKHDSHVCRTTFREVLGPPSQPAVNFLDIPSPASVTPPSFLSALSLDSAAGQIPFEDGYPQYSVKWHLLATIAALSAAHIDAGKFATWLHILRGAKVWAVLEGTPPNTPLVSLKVEKYKWKVFLLEQDDILIMPPGTVHVVLNILDCFASGGHFYAKHSLDLSLLAGNREYISGHTDTNTQHIGAEAILHALLHNYASNIPSEHPPKDSQKYNAIVRTWPPLAQMAALIVMCGHPLYFEPVKVSRQPYTCTDSMMNLRHRSETTIPLLLTFCPDLLPLVKHAEQKIRKRKGAPPFTSLCPSLDDPSSPATAKPTRCDPSPSGPDHSPPSSQAESEEDSTQAASIRAETFSPRLRRIQQGNLKTLALSEQSHPISSKGTRKRVAKASTSGPSSKRPRTEQSHP